MDQPNTQAWGPDSRASAPDDGGPGEVFRRVVVGHWPVIVVLTLAPLVVLLLFGRPAAQYQASARIQAATHSATSSRIEADAMADRVHALATTPSVAAAAAKQAGVPVDAADLVAHDVTTAPLGLSPLVDITVRASDPHAAAALASALATQVVTFLDRSSTTGSATPARPDPTAVQAAQADLAKRLADSANQISKLQGQLSGVAPNTSRAIVLQEALAAEQNLHTQLLVEQVREQTDAATQPVPADPQASAVVVDGAAAAPTQVPNRFLARLGLGLLAGLALGLVVAAVLEAIRPRVPDGRGLARELGVPLLACAPTDAIARPDVVGDARGPIALAAARRDVSTVLLAPLRPGDRPAALALGEALSAEDGDGAASGGRRGHPRVEVLGDWPAHGELTGDVGLVAVGRVPVLRRHVEQLRDVLLATGWPLLGVVTTSGRGVAARHGDATTATPAGREAPAAGRPARRVPSRTFTGSTAPSSQPPSSTPGDRRPVSRTSGNGAGPTDPSATDAVTP